MEKVNYNEEFKILIESLDETKDKPTLFLHACCGPCLTYPLTELIKYFKVTIGYINPNIFPMSEYELRFNELKRFIDEINEVYKEKIEIVKYDYDYSVFLDAVKGHELDKEGGERCTICHRLRLDESYKYASEHDFDYFTSVMSVSSKKPSSLLNQICFELENKYMNTKYVPADFKKENGTLKGINICKNYKLYRQDYCGCSFSKKERQEYIKQLKNK
jgi:predicted adenine nucleotide alpha hydrolase (AANH) superfamily ATPase